MPRTSSSDKVYLQVEIPTKMMHQLEELAATTVPRTLGRSQFIIRILEEYIADRVPEAWTATIKPKDIRSTIAAHAMRDEMCSVTGIPIRAGSMMLLAQTGWGGRLMPVSIECLQSINLAQQKAVEIAEQSTVKQS
jgi:hypothetical protein